MEKALHDYFYISMDGVIKPYSKVDSKFLVEGANNHLTKLKNRRQNMKALDYFLYECMDDYFRNGITDNLLNKLNKEMEKIRHQCLVENSHRKLIAVHIAHIPFNPPPTIFAAYMFSHITSLGGLKGLKRCHMYTCQKFFIGRSNNKWCSKSCGSKFRVTQKRKRDRK